MEKATNSAKFSSNHTAIINYNLRNYPLFENDSPTDKTQISKIKAVLKKFVERKFEEKELAEFSEDVQESLKDIHNFYQIESCESNMVNEEDFSEFCSLVDECINKKLEELNNTLSELKKRKRSKPENNENQAEESETLKKIKTAQEQFNKEAAEKLKMANERGNVQPVVEFSEDLRIRALGFNLFPDEDQHRTGYHCEWLDSKLDWQSVEEVEFILDNKEKISSIVKFHQRFSYDTLLDLERGCREHFIHNAQKIVYLFECDKLLTCRKLMKAPLEVRNFVFDNAQELSLFTKEIVNFLPIEKIITCSCDQIQKILNNKDLFLKNTNHFKTIVEIREVPLEKLLELENEKLVVLFQDIHSESSIEFLKEYSMPYDIIWMNEEEFIMQSEQDQLKINKYCVEIRALISCFDAEAVILFEKIDSELINVAIEEIWKIEKLLTTDNLIPLDVAGEAIKGAIYIINNFEIDEVKKIENIASDKLKIYIIENSDWFKSWFVTQEIYILEDFKEMSLATFKEISFNPDQFFVGDQDAQKQNEEEFLVDENEEDQEVPVEQNEEDEANSGTEEIIWLN